MRSTFSLLPYINRSKVKADGTTAVLCRITIDGKQTVISTGIYCRPEDWNGRKNEIKTVRENNRLREYLRLHTLWHILKRFTIQQNGPLKRMKRNWLRFPERIFLH